MIMFGAFPIAGNAGWDKIGPFVTKPVIAGMICALNSFFGSIMFHVGFADAFTVSAFVFV